MDLTELRKNEMMAYLLDSLEAGRDIGHYGRLVFTMVARSFLAPEEIVTLLQKGADCDEVKARGLVEQVVDPGGAFDATGASWIRIWTGRAS